VTVEIGELKWLMHKSGSGVEIADGLIDSQVTPSSVALRETQNGCALGVRFYTLHRKGPKNAVPNPS